MDKLYMILLCLMIVPILICIKYSRKIKSDVASSIVKCLIFAIVTILSNGLSAFSGKIRYSGRKEAPFSPNGQGGLPPEEVISWYCGPRGPGWCCCPLTASCPTRASPGTILTKPPWRSWRSPSAAGGCCSP